MSHLFTILRQRANHQKALALALPMILSNITVPLLGLVDTAVIGHLSEAYYLGGVAVGAMIISFLFWLLFFLRMATTGLVAQAYGAADRLGQLRVLYQAVIMALLLALSLLLLQQPILALALDWIGSSDEVAHYASVYFSARIWSAPAALVNLALLGYLLGRHQPKSAMWLLLCTNIVNILLDILFVLGLGLGVAGAAWASVIADYCALILALYFVWRDLPIHLKNKASWQQLSLADSGKLLALNRDIFIRSLCLQLCIAFVTAQGAQMGDNIVAANAVLMNFTLLMAYALDGFAYYAEAEVGRAYGGRDRAGVYQAVVIGGFWSLLCALGFALSFCLFGTQLIALLTDLASVRETAATYLNWIALYPLMAFICFLFDGVYIGAAKGRIMRNSMLVSALGFFAIWQLGLQLKPEELANNHLLWLAFAGFAWLRSLTLLAHFTYSWRRNHWL